MIALYALDEPCQSVDIQARFLEMLPTIRRVAKYAFCRSPRVVREDLVAEVVANAFVAFRRLVERGKASLAYASVLAWYAVRQVREGRRVGNRLNVNDVLSIYAQRRKGFHVESLSMKGITGKWEDLVVEDKRTTPAEIAACRLDFRAWLRRLNRRNRGVALKLAGGETTKAAAQIFKISEARISQLRRELHDSWQEFQGEKLAAA